MGFPGHPYLSVRIVRAGGAHRRNVLLVGRAALINRLRSIAASDDSAFESERRARFAEKLDALRRERIAHPQVLVEAPVSIVNMELADLPAGVTIAPGQMTIAETDGKRAVEKLLAVAMAIGNQFEEFDEILSGR